MASSRYSKRNSFWENYQSPDKFGQWLGYEMVKFDEKRKEAHLSLKIQENHLSPAGRVHGGVISALFDATCGAAVFSTLAPKELCSTVELKVNYLRPILLGDTVRAEAKVVFRGKRTCVTHGFLYGEGGGGSKGKGKGKGKSGGKPLAMVTATFNVVPSN